MRCAASSLVMASILVLASGQAIAQNKQAPPAKDPKDKQTQPAAAPPKNPELLPGPYITRDMPKDWTLRSRVRITSNPPGMGAQILALPPGQLRDDNAVNAGNQPVFSFQTLTVVFPIAPETAGCAPKEGSDAVQGWLQVDDRQVSDQPSIKSKQSIGKLLGAGARFAQFTTQTGSEPTEVPNGMAREVQIQVEVPMTCYRTKFDEKAAMEVEWPKNDWPPVVKAVFQPQVYVETGNDGRPYDAAKIKETANKWAGGDPHLLRPVELAKTIAAEVVRNIQPSGDGKAVLRTGELQGFLLNGVDQTLATGKGTEYDITCLLTALYRAAGLPARVIIGVEAEDVDRKFLEKRGGKGKLRTWVEFALYDEVNNTLNWVPVDIVKIRKQSSRPQPVRNPWKYFGSHDELNLITPIALHFHPPTSVIAYSVPGLWGWMVTPAPPSQAYQALYFDAYRSSKGPIDPRDPKNKGKEK